MASRTRENARTAWYDKRKASRGTSSSQKRMAGAGKTSVSVDTKAVPHKPAHKPISITAKIGKYKGGSSYSSYSFSPNYHSQSNKAARKRARVAEGKRLKSKKTRYDQLM